MICNFKFHGVGQGLFYTADLICNEKNVARFIYDCGSDNTQYLDNAIDAYHKEQSSNMGKISVEFLTISHLHRDHVNGLPKLLKFVTPKKIYLPYFDVKTYEEVFKAYLVCAEITPQSDEYSLMMNWYTDSNQNNVEFIKETEKTVSLPEWDFCFFNLQTDNSKYDLLCREIQRLLSSYYILSIEEYVEAKRDLKDLKKIFLSVLGKSYQNATSLLLLHYARKNPRTKTLLTGDVPFDSHLETRVLKHLSGATDLILQVPHHGAYVEWNKLPVTIKDKSTDMVISFGLGNKHRHPSAKCVNDILLLHSKSKLNCAFQGNSYENRIL